MTRQPIHLRARVEGVPLPKPPVNWDRDLRVEENLLGIEAWIGHYRDKLPPHAFIDEAAILVPNYWHKSRVAGALQKAGWVEFNNAQDVVYTNPFGTRYCVEYTFFRHVDKPYRLEMMMIIEDDDGLRGFSPLHHALVAPTTATPVSTLSATRYPIPHLSFKYPGDPSQRGYSKAIQHLQEQACIHAMTCQSSYGTFGYFIGNETMRQIYLKPRVNLRDETPIGLLK